MTDKPEKTTVSAYVDQATKDRLQALATLDDRSVSYLAGKILTDWVEQNALAEASGQTS